VGASLLQHTAPSSRSDREVTSCWAQNQELCLVVAGSCYTLTVAFFVNPIADEETEAQKSEVTCPWSSRFFSSVKPLLEVLLGLNTA
jgi:hypothetical protein